MHARVQDVSFIRQTLPFFLLCLLVVGIALILSLSFPPSKALHPTGGPGSFINARTFSSHFPSRNLEGNTTFLNTTNTEAANITSTIIVLSMDDDRMELLVILGNMTIEDLGERRLMEDSDDEDIIGDEVQALMVTANPTTGVVLNVTKTNATDEAFARVGLNIVREMLVNQDINAYDNFTAKRSGGNEDCLYPDDVQGNELCPKFYEESTPTTRKFIREYNESSIKGRRLVEDNHYNMSFRFETAVNAQTGLLERADSSGTVSIAVHKSNNGPISKAVLAHSSSTNFDVQVEVLTKLDIVYVKELIEKTTFLPLNLNSPRIPTQNQTLEERELSKTIMNSTKSVNIINLMGVNVNVVANMIMKDSSLIISLIMEFHGYESYKLMDKTFGADAVRAIKQVLGLRDYVKTEMEKLNSYISAYVVKVENVLANMTLDKIADMNAKTAIMKAVFINVSVLLQQKLNAYKDRAEHIVEAIQTYFENYIPEAEKEIADLKSSADTEIADLKASLQPVLDDYQNELRTVLNQIKQTEAEIDALQNAALNQTQLSQIAEYNKTLNDFSAIRDEYIGKLSSANEEIAAFIDNQTAQTELKISKTRASMDQQIADIQRRSDSQIQQYSRNMAAALDSYRVMLDEAIVNITRIQAEISLKNKLTDSQEKAKKIIELNNDLITLTAVSDEINEKMANATAERDAYVIQQKAEAAALISVAISALNKAIFDIEQESSLVLASYSTIKEPVLEELKSTLANATLKVENATTAIDSVKVQLLSPEKQDQVTNFTTTLNQSIAERDKIKANIMNLKAAITQYEIDKRAAHEALVYTLKTDAIEQIQVLNNTYKADQQKEELDTKTALVQSQLDDALATALNITETDIENFQNSKQTELSSLNNQLIAIVSSIHDLNIQILTLKNSGYSAEIQAKLKQLDDQLALYKARQVELEDFESGILDKIAKFVNQKKAIVKLVTSTIQTRIDITQAILDAITAGTFCWQAEFERFGLTVLSDILNPYKAAKENLDKAIDDVRIISGDLTTLVNESTEGFKSAVSSSSGEISSSFKNISNQDLKVPEGDENIFDFSCVDRILASVKKALNDVSNKTTGMKDDLSKNVNKVATELLSVFKLDHWLGSFADIKKSISALEKKYGFAGNIGDIDEFWLRRAFESVTSNATTEIYRTDITASASALSPELTGSIIKDMDDINANKSILIFEHLSQQVKPKKKHEISIQTPTKHPIGPPIITPYGKILVEWDITISAELEEAVSVTLNSLIVSVDPVITERFNATAEWNFGESIMGVEAVVMANASLPCVIKMIESKRKIATSVNFVFILQGDIFQYIKELGTIIFPVCRTVRRHRRRRRVCTNLIIKSWSPKTEVNIYSIPKGDSKQMMAIPMT